MRTTMRAALAAAALAAVVGTAIAADMTGDEIKATISGKTVYLECGDDPLRVGRFLHVRCSRVLTRGTAMAGGALRSSRGSASRGHRRI